MKIKLLTVFFISYEAGFGGYAGSCLKMEMKHERIMHG